MTLLDTAQLLGNFGEFAGAIAVVVTLIYLASQIRFSNRLARAEAFRTPMSDLNSMNAQYMQVSEFRQAFPYVYNGASRTDLDREQQFVIDSYMVSITNIFEQLHREVGEGIISSHVLADNSIIPLFESPYYRSSWHLYKRAYGSSFVNDFEGRFNL